MSADSRSDPVRTSAERFEQRLVDELSLTDWRALIVVVVAPSGYEQEADRACANAVSSSHIPPDRVLRWVVSRNAAGRAQLREFNRARDTLLASHRLIYLRVGSAEDVRFLRRVAPDLTAAIDVFVELVAAPTGSSDWGECQRQVRALMMDRHGELDFRGLLPASVDQRVLPLDQLYLSLVDLRSRQVSFEFARDNAWLVLGHPGTGKTTFVRHLAWTYARGEDDPLELGVKLPVLLSLSDYGHEREQNRVAGLIEFLPRWLSEQGVTHASAVLEQLPRVLLLLDGLDELRSTEARRGVLTEVEQLLHAGRIGGVVVTGRSYLVDELRERNYGLRLCTTRAPTREEVHAFVRNFVRLQRGDERHAEQLVARIEADPDLRALAQTPLMLAFMVVLDELEGRLPDRRIEIYYRLGEMLVERWTRARSIGASTTRRERPTRADALRVLGPLAWWTVERGGGAVDEVSLLREIERIEARRETPEEARRRATALLELLGKDTALLVPIGQQRWTFVHPSIAEYFAGVEAERAPERWQALLEDPFRAEWREIVLFCAGQLGVIEGRMSSLDQLVNAILHKSRRAGRYDAKYPSLLMGLLAESPGLSSEQISHIVRRLLEFVFQTAFSVRSRWQVQREFVALLGASSPSVHVVLAAQLRDSFGARAASIRWDRVFMFSELPDVLMATDAEIVAFLVLGPWISSIREWASAFQIDLQPILRRWASLPGSAYQFARWWVQTDPEARGRTLAEIWDELPSPASAHH